MPSSSPAPMRKQNNQSSTRPSARTTADIKSSPSSSASSAKEFAEKVLAVSKKSENVKQGGILMADGSLRTKDHVIIKPAGWQNSSNPVVKAWRAVRRRYLALMLRWPRWARRATLVGIILVLAINAAVLVNVARNSRLFNRDGADLPSTGIVEADGSKYYVEKAEWQYAGVLNGWSIDNAPTNNGKLYKSSDGACSISVLSDALNSGSTQLDVLTGQARDKYLKMPSGVKVEAELADSTVGATGGEQKYALQSHRYNYYFFFNDTATTEIYTRTLANKSFLIIHTCETSSWDQSQAARDSITGSLRIAAR